MLETVNRCKSSTCWRITHVSFLLLLGFQGVFSSLRRRNATSFPSFPSLSSVIWTSVSFSSLPSRSPPRFFSLWSSRPVFACALGGTLSVPLRPLLLPFPVFPLVAGGVPSCFSLPFSSWGFPCAQSFGKQALQVSRLRRHLTQALYQPRKSICTSARISGFLSDGCCGSSALLADAPPLPPLPAPVAPPLPPLPVPVADPSVPTVSARLSTRILLLAGHLAHPAPAVPRALDFSVSPLLRSCCITSVSSVFDEVETLKRTFQDTASQVAAIGATSARWFWRPQGVGGRPPSGKLSPGSPPNPALCGVLRCRATCQLWDFSAHQLHPSSGKRASNPQVRSTVKVSLASEQFACSYHHHHMHERNYS